MALVAKQSKGLRAEWARLMQHGQPVLRIASSPASVGRATGGRAGFMAAPYLAEVQIGGVWRWERSVRLSVLAAHELGRLMDQGASCVCPVVLQASISETAQMRPDAAPVLAARDWQAWVQPFLNAAGFVVVPDLPGWQNCPEILAQARWALARNIPVHLYASGV